MSANVINFPGNRGAGTRTATLHETSSDARPAAVIPTCNPDRPRPSVLRVVGRQGAARRTRPARPFDEPPPSAA